MTTAWALVKATTEKLEGMRNNETFAKLYVASGSFCNDCGIEVPQEQDAATSRSRRNVVLPSSLKDSIVLTTLGKRQVVPVEVEKSNTSWQPQPDNLLSNLRQQMFAVLDNMTGELSAGLLTLNHCYFVVTLSIPAVAHLWTFSPCSLWLTPTVTWELMLTG